MCDHENSTRGEPHRSPDELNSLRLREFVEFTGVGWQTDGTGAGRAGEFDQIPQILAGDLLLLSKGSRDDRDDSIDPKCPRWLQNVSLMASVLGPERFERRHWFSRF